MQSFTTAQRLHSSREFDALYRHGQRRGDNFFLILFRDNQRPHARLGLSVSAKAVGNAVNRNRVKRVVRESFRLHQIELPHVDLVVNARVASRKAGNAELNRSLEVLWTTIAQQCARSSSH